MIEIENLKDAFGVSVILSSLLGSWITLLGIALNGKKVWVESNKFILGTEILIYSFVLIWAIAESWREANI